MKDHDTFRCAALTIGLGCTLWDFARGGKIARARVSGRRFEICASSTGASDPNFLLRIRTSILDPRLEPGISSAVSKCGCEKD